MKLKNLAIVAHVDHGKTTLIDELLKQSGVYASHQAVTERVMDSGELEKERGITIKAKNCSITWNGVKINLLDTPGHADFGGEVERSLMMVDGIMLLVDAAEGPLPQTRFVLQKAIQAGIKIAVFINKVDRHDQRSDEVFNEVENLLLELIDLEGVEDYDLDLPIFYGSGRDGYAGKTADIRSGTLSPLLDFMVSDFYPSPKTDVDAPFQMLVTNLAYSPYLGMQMIGRIKRGKIAKNQMATMMKKNDFKKNFRVTSISIFSGLGQALVEEVEAGEIAIISGFEEPEIGDTVCGTEKAEALPRLKVDPPTVSVDVSVNTSPLSGKEGEYLTSRGLEDFLIEATKKNVSLEYAPTDDPKVFRMKARGELQVAIVFEEIRRAGYELMIARPQVLLKEENGQTLEPFERVVIDIPTEFTGTITETLSNRKGMMENMAPLGEGRTRMEFVMPSRGLIGFRSKFLTDTKGQGLMSSYFLDYRPHVGKMLSRQLGSLICDRKGVATVYALWNLLDSGRQFISPQQEVYEGMVMGEHTRSNELNVNPAREKHVNNVRTKNKDENMILPPPVEMTLEFALDWIDDDEWVEVTPQNVRIRKKILEQNKRSVIR
ncbi:MAG: translational GTPase TypA [Bacteriovoracaceae bacterium]|nr:translational GTPase TypA [Bacteriovoracaceae bacterium]